MDIRYLVFAYDKYYPLGGGRDLRSVHEFVATAINSAENAVDEQDHSHVYDIKISKIIKIYTKYPQE